MCFGNYNEIAEYSPSHSDWEFIPLYYDDYWNDCSITLDKYEPYVYINGN
jgi:hypothetical protein